MGSGWLRGKTLERQDSQNVTFRCEQSGRRWRFHLESHVLVEVDGAGVRVGHAPHAGDVRASAQPPKTIAEADAWFRRRHEGRSSAPAHPPHADRAVAKWGDRHFMVTCTLGPFVAVAYSFGYESSLILLAEHPRVFAHLATLFLQHFEAHYEWAAKAGYDGGHIVESWVSADTISPDPYRRWIAPIHRDAARMIQSKGLKADIYNPGYSMPLLLHLRGQGWDAIRLDDLCRGQDQDIGEARKILGPGQCLFGNMSAYSLLRGEWKDISARTLYQYEAAGKEGAFIISSGSGICDQTDPAIIDRWLSYARSLSGQGG
jgi:uroporphyrinogen-III decarboxylase